MNLENNMLTINTPSTAFDRRYGIDRRRTVMPEWKQIADQIDRLLSSPADLHEALVEFGHVRDGNLQELQDAIMRAREELEA